MEKKLKEFLEKGKDWEKLPTQIPGVFVVKVPGTKSRPAKLMVEVNPVDKTGQPKKRKGLFIADFEMYLQFSEALHDDKLAELIRTLEEFNPKETKADNTVLEW